MRIILLTETHAETEGQVPDSRLLLIAIGRTKFVRANERFGENRERSLRRQTTVLLPPPQTADPIQTSGCCSWGRGRRLKKVSGMEFVTVGQWVSMRTEGLATSPFPIILKGHSSGRTLAFVDFEFQSSAMLCCVTKVQC